MLNNIFIITNDISLEIQYKKITEVIKYGAKFIGIRNKKENFNNIYELCKKIKTFLNENKQFFDVNIVIFHHKTIAKKLNLGLHVSITDYTDKLKNDYKLLGVSCHTKKDIIKIKNADYITISPAFNSISKKGYMGKGAGFINDLNSFANENVQTYALGGITKNNYKNLDTYGIAMCGYIMNNPNNFLDFIIKKT